MEVQRLCADPKCRKKFKPVTDWHEFCSPRCRTRVAVARFRARKRYGNDDGPQGGKRQRRLFPKLVPAKAKAAVEVKQEPLFSETGVRATFAVSDKGGATGITLTSRKPAHRVRSAHPVATAILIAFLGLFLSTFHASRVYASSFSITPPEANEGAPAKENALVQTSRLAARRPPQACPLHAASPRSRVPAVLLRRDSGMWAHGANLPPSRSADRDAAALPELQRRAIDSQETAAVSASSCRTICARTGVEDSAADPRGLKGAS